MYAIVEIAGQQFKVEKDQQIFVHQLEGEEGSQVEFHDVYLVDNDGSVMIGMPVVEGAAVTAKILGHVKGDKVLVFKKKRRKGYQTLNGHRQQFSQILIEDIILGGDKKPHKAKKAKAPVVTETEVPVAPAVVEEINLTDVAAAEAPLAEIPVVETPETEITQHGSEVEESPSKPEGENNQ